MTTLLAAFVLTLGTIAGPAPAVADTAPQAVEAPAPTLIASPLEQAIAQARKELDPDVGAQATCSNVCTEGANLSCQYASSCTAVDQNCAAGVRGYVTCDGQTTYCTKCPEVETCFLWECRSQCNCPGGFSHCYDTVNCLCECIYQ